MRCSSPTRISVSSSKDTLPRKHTCFICLLAEQVNTMDSRKWLACINERIVCMLRSRMLHSEDAQVSTDRLLSVAVEASAAAGKMLLNYARSGFHIQRKNHHINLVTDADHAAEECIIDHIHRHFPSHRTLAEERGAGVDAPSRYRW